MAEIEAGGVRFHYQRLGTGRHTAVFIHGLVMDNLSSWYFTVANQVAKQPDFEALVYDLRGHGQSQRPSNGYSLDDMTDDLVGLLDALGINAPVFLVGNSFGGLLAVKFALRCPEQVAGLVLVDGHLSDAAWAAEMTATLELQGAERDRMIAESFRHWLGRHSERKRNRLAETAKAIVYGTSLVDDLKHSQPIDDATLRTIKAPALALYGEGSDVRAVGERLGRTVPNCILKMIPKCSHSVLWEETALVRDDIVDWLTRRIA